MTVFAEHIFKSYTTHALAVMYIKSNLFSGIKGLFVVVPAVSFHITQNKSLEHFIKCCMQLSKCAAKVVVNQVSSKNLYPMLLS